MNDNVYEFNIDEPSFIKQLTGENTSSANDALEYYSPMPGVIDKINVKPGDVIKKGDSLLVMYVLLTHYLLY